MNKIIKQITQSTNLSTQQAWWLLEFITNSSRSHLQFSSENLTESQQKLLDESLEQVSVHHKPLAYILRWVPFLDLKLFVAPPTLIPRPETESWVHDLITMIKNDTTDTLTILDVGTGSGCIALSLAQAFPSSDVYALDIADSAITLTKKNAVENNITNITCLQSDLFSNVPTNLKFDLIVSNPPYINPTAQLDLSVVNWEDHNALFADNQGLQIIEKIIAQSKNYLKSNDKLTYQLVMEIDVSQGNVVKKLFKNNSFKHIEIKKDQFERDRTVWIK